MIRKVAITGPESTGKSAMASALAKAFHTKWVPEYAREYIRSLDRPYTLEDVEKIAAGQLQAEGRLMLEANKILICDTDLIVIKIWCDFVFGSCPAWIEREIVRQKYDLHLLMNIDLPWQYDPQREHPDKRNELFERYVEELKKHKMNFEIISGHGEVRVQNAIEVIKNHQLISF